MKRFVIELLLVALIATAPTVAVAQTVTVAFHPMPIYKQRVGLWLTAKEVADVEVVFPDFPYRVHRLKRGQDDKGQATIPPTYSRGILRRNVDPCVCSGILEDGSSFSLSLPREPIRGRVAVAITCQGTITRPNGKVYQMTVTIPDCVTRRDGFRRRLADAVIGTGTLR